MESDQQDVSSGGVPTFIYNFLGTARIPFTAKEALPRGKVKLVVDFKYDGGGQGG